MDDPTVDHDAIPVGREDEQIHVYAALVGGDVADALNDIAHELRTANLIAAAQLVAKHPTGETQMFTVPVIQHAISDIADRLGISASRAEGPETAPIVDPAPTRAFRHGRPVDQS